MRSAPFVEPDPIKGVLGPTLAKNRPGRPIYGPEALLRNIGYAVLGPGTPGGGPRGERPDGQSPQEVNGFGPVLTRIRGGVIYIYIYIYIYSFWAGFDPVLGRF